MEVAVCFCINDNYAQHLSVTLASLLVNNKRSQFDVRILSRDLTDDSKARIGKLGERFHNFSITYISVPEELCHGFSAGSLSHVSIDTYLRYFIPEFCPDLNKALYLDVDLVVRGRLEELWNIDVSGYYAAGVPDMYLNTDEYKDKTGDPGHLNYINAGVLLLNLRRIREENKVQELVETTRRRPELLEYCDQNILNIVFSDGIKYVSQRFNYDSHRMKYNEKHPRRIVITHFTTSEKPWLYHRYIHKNFISRLKSKYRYQAMIRKQYNKYMKYTDFAGSKISELTQ